MIRRLVAIIALMTVALGCLTLVNAPAQASARLASSVRAVGSWSMEPLSKDTNNDGVIDGDGGVPARGALTSQPSATYVGAGNHRAQPNERLINGTTSWYLPTTGFPVRLDACTSTGAQYRWTASQNGSEVTVTPWLSLSKKTCATSVNLANGPTTLRLEVKSGASHAVTVLDANPRGLIVVALGDSYASGEGNPRNVQSWLQGSLPFRPYWDNDPCHRSVLGAPAQAALALEKASPRTSVELIDVTCAGATVNAGVLGAQQAVGQATSQVEQAAAVLGDRTADAIVLQVGGNDVGFSSVLGACVLNTQCPLSRAPFPPLSTYKTLQDGVQAETGKLTAAYARIAACLGGSSCVLADGRRASGIRLTTGATVLPVLYPDLTRNANGAPCTYLTMSQTDFAWARDTMLVPNPGPTYAYPTAQGPVTLSLAQGTLNAKIAQTGGQLGWAPVTGAWEASGVSPVGHGVCAGTQAWVFGITSLSGFSSASFHPNPTGVAAMGKAIQAALAVAVRP